MPSEGLDLAPEERHALGVAWAATQFLSSSAGALAVLFCTALSAHAQAPTSPESTVAPSADPKAPPPAQPDDEEKAVELARSAFEYRDFKKVAEVLDPWLHPPRIVDTKRMIEARELMGVSLHILGRVDGAKEEFSYLLLDSPKHQLDPFVIPPAVIQSFEAVRDEMRPKLDEILKRRGEPLVEEEPTKIELVEIPSPVVVWAPFGIPQFVLDDVGWGVVWLVVQAIGLTTNIVSYLREAAVDPDPASDGTYNALVAVQYVGLGAFIAGWAGSSIQGHFALDRRRELLREEARSARAAPATQALGPVLGFSLTF